MGRKERWVRVGDKGKPEPPPVIFRRTTGRTDGRRRRTDVDGRTKDGRRRDGRQDGRTDRGRRLRRLRRRRDTTGHDGTDGEGIRYLSKSISMVYPSKQTRTDISRLANKSVNRCASFYYICVTKFVIYIYIYTLLYIGFKYKILQKFSKQYYIYILNSIIYVFYTIQFNFLYIWTYLKVHFWKMKI